MHAGLLLKDMFDAAIAAADPFRTVAPNLPRKPKGRAVVVGAGKASARMAQAVEACWGECEGIVVVPYGSALPCRGIRIVEASHPVPDAAGERASGEILSLLAELSEDDFALFLISGGGSSLLSRPLDGVVLADKQAVNRQLLMSGASIDEMNVVRKHLSATKGGRLSAAAAPATMLTLAISDVPGDDVSTIASGPTVPDSSTVCDAKQIIERYGLKLPQQMMAVLETPQAATPEADSAVFERSEVKIISTAQASLEAAAAVARKAGVTPVILGDAIEGEAREVGKVMAGIASQVHLHGQPVAGRVVLISGGETTVTVQGDAGKGGRNSEFLLSLALACWNIPELSAISCDTDGRDGSEFNAGALWLPEHRQIANRNEALDFLSRHDAFSFFKRYEAIVMTGPTHTNVNDFRAIYVETRDEG